MVKYIELCAGIGGFRQGLEAVGGFECVGWSEIDKYASLLYSHYYNDNNNFGDVTKINAEELPDFDLLVGGFPCQAFSISGKREGFEDTRGTVFFDFARIIKVKQPKVCIFENVRGLLNHDDGATYGKILRTMDELGYDVQWGVFNTKFHGLPQNRERVYIVGNLRRECATKILFERGYGFKDSLGINIVGRYTTKSGYSGQNHGVVSIDGISKCLLARDYKEPKIILLGKIDNKSNQGLRVYGEDGISITITANGGGTGGKTGLYNINDIVRRLTPLECFRLQGFKDDMVEKGRELNISDSQLYKMAGNAVSVPVVSCVAEIVKEAYFE